MRRHVPLFLACLTALLIVSGPLAYSFYSQKHIRNFKMVHKDVLYRSGQMSISGLKSVIRDFGINTVISLRDAPHRGEPAPDLKEERFCEKEGLRYCRISPQVWSDVEGHIPAQEGVDKFLAIMDDPSNYPVLIHCFGGIHRSGAFTAIYRMEYEGWNNADAIAELRANGYTALEDEWNLLAYLEQFQPRHR